MDVILPTIHILSAVILIGLVLLQQGKGADVGATLGGDSSSLFGPTIENPLRNATTTIAFVFMITSVWLAYFGRITAPADGGLFSREHAPISETSNEAAKPISVDADNVVNQEIPVDVNPQEMPLQGEPVKPESNVADTSGDTDSIPTQ